MRSQARRPTPGSYQDCAYTLLVHGFRRTDHGLITTFTYDTGGLFLVRVTLSDRSDSAARLELGARAPDGSRRWRPWGLRQVSGTVACTREALGFLAVVT